MKNITVTVNDEIYLQARIWAAQHNTSVSALVQKFLETLDDDPCSDLYLLDSSPEAIECPSPPLL